MAASQRTECPPRESDARAAINRMSRTHPRVGNSRPSRIVNISIHIDAPPQHVWNVMTDVERWPEWTASVLRVRRLDSAAFGVGSRARIRQPMFLPAVWEVTRLEPGRSFTWVTRSPGLLVTGSHAVQRSGTGSLAKLSVAYDGLLAGPVARLLGATTHRFLSLEANGLKKRSEASTRPYPISP